MASKSAMVNRPDLYEATQLPAGVTRFVVVTMWHGLSVSSELVV